LRVCTQKKVGNRKAKSTAGEATTMGLVENVENISQENWGNEVTI
jgi:hypothetical protein